MKQKQTDCILLGVSIGSYLIMSISFLLMPIEAANILPGLMFWGGLAVGVALQIVLEIRRRAFFASYRVKREKMQKPRNGLLSFGSNRAARLADLSMVVSLIAAILVFIFTKGYGYVCYVFIATTLFSFCLHCILNGRIYFHVKKQKKIRRVLEQKRANYSDKGEGEK